MLGSRKYLPVCSPKIEWKVSHNWLRQLPKVITHLGLIGPLLDPPVIDGAPAKKMLTHFSSIYEILPWHSVDPLAAAADVRCSPSYEHRYVSGT